MTQAQAKKIAIAAVNRMEPFMRSGYRSHESNTGFLYIPYIPLVRMSPDFPEMKSLGAAVKLWRKGIKNWRKSLYKRERIVS